MDREAVVLEVAEVSPAVHAAVRSIPRLAYTEAGGGGGGDGGGGDGGGDGGGGDGGGDGGGGDGGGDGGGGDGGGDGGGGGDPDPNAGGGGDPDTGKTVEERAAEEKKRADGLEKALEDERRLRRKETERAKKALSEDDFAEWQQFKASKRDAEAERLKQEGKFDELVEMRSRERVLAAEEQRDKAINERNESNALLDKLVVEQALMAAANDPGVKIKTTAISDMLMHARLPDADGKQWKRDGESALLYDPENNALRSYADPSKPMSPVEWLRGMEPQKPHWFEDSEGGGAGGGAGGGGGGGGRRNPMGLKKSQMSMQEKSDYINQNGEEAYNKLPE